MIEPRTNTTGGPLHVEAESHATLQRLAAPMRPAYGTWHTFESEADALCAVITEIGEIVLARCIRVTLQDSTREIVLTISNRHLIAISGVAIDPQAGEATAITNGIQKTLAGVRCLKFDIVQRSPNLPNASRSWSHKALMEATIDMADPSGSHAALLEAVKEMSFAWVDLATQTDAGDRDTLVMLHQVATKRHARLQDQVRISREKSQITIISVEDKCLCVEVELASDVLIALCDDQSQSSLIHLWRSYLATRSSQ